jgi:hypothetical protein
MPTERQSTRFTPTTYDDQPQTLLANYTVGLYPSLLSSILFPTDVRGVYI